MKILIASLQCESNTCSPIPTVRDDFDFAAGEAMLAKVHIEDLLLEAGATIVPTIYAHALPGGAMDKEDYLWFVEQILAPLEKEEVDGIWLYLHGALYVDEIGSGESYLLKRLRERVGNEIPIAVGLDFHANNEDVLVELANIVCGFRTAPHTDQIATERKTMNLLLHILKNKLLPTPRIARPYVIIPGDVVQTAIHPMNKIMEEADRIEGEAGVLCAQVFAGQQWVDSPFTGPSIVVTHESDPALAQRYADELSRLYWDNRHEFSFLVDALEPQDALDLALSLSNQWVFISDSGDNTTAGASGDNAFFIEMVKNSGGTNILIAGIADKEATLHCYERAIGDKVDLEVGGSLSEKSVRTSISGTLVHKGDILGYTGEYAGRSATIDCGDFTVVVTENRTPFTREDIFESIDLDPRQFQTVVVKLGYLFPDLAKMAEKSILAFTPGSSAERTEDLGLEKIRRPMFPFDDDFYEDSP
ncbi:MAG: M81 family metallopeptidase [Spirochaetales bacterium]|nr:M81 family metallopeptidase [Spirochaetales bacterium]